MSPSLILPSSTSPASPSKLGATTQKQRHNSISLTFFHQLQRHFLPVAAAYSGYVTATSLRRKGRSEGPDALASARLQRTGVEC